MAVDPEQDLTFNLRAIARERIGDSVLMQKKYDYYLRILIEALWERIEFEDAVHITNVTGDITAKDDDWLLVDASGGDIDITLPEKGALTIKRIDETGNAVTLIGTVDDIVNPTMEFRDGWRLFGQNNQFWIA